MKECCIEMIHTAEARDQCAGYAEMDTLPRDIAAVDAQAWCALEIGAELLDKRVQDGCIGLDELRNNFAEGFCRLHKLPQHQGRSSFFAKQHLYKFMDVLTQGLLRSGPCAHSRSMLLALTRGIPECLGMDEMVTETFLIKLFLAAEMIADSRDVDRSCICKIAHAGTRVATGSEAVGSDVEEALTSFCRSGRICLKASHCMLGALSRSLCDGARWFAMRHYLIQTFV